MTEIPEPTHPSKVRPTTYKSYYGNYYRAPYTEDEIRQQAEEIQELRDQGYTIRRIALAMGVTEATIHTRLKRAKSLPTPEEVEAKRQQYRDHLAKAKEKARKIPPGEFTFGDLL